MSMKVQISRSIIACKTTQHKCDLCPPDSSRFYNPVWEDVGKSDLSHLPAVSKSNSNPHTISFLPTQPVVENYSAPNDLLRQRWTINNNSPILGEAAGGAATVECNHTLPVFDRTLAVWPESKIFQEICSPNTEGSLSLQDL